jgi:hypothetical protein
MENTSKRDKAISRRDRAYYRRRQQNRVYVKLAQFFANEAEAGRITKKEIAEKLEKDAAQITRWLSTPSNLELDTISDILLSMGAEMDHAVVRFSDRAKPNYFHPSSTQATAIPKKDAAPVKPLPKIIRGPIPPPETTAT